MSLLQFYNGHRVPKLFRAYKPSENTKGREFMNTVILPRFAKFFKDDDLIYNIGQHVFWDYSIIFNNMKLRCNYLTTDIDPTQGNPDIIDDITNSKLESNTADGIIYVGMSDIVQDHPKALEHIYRILKPGGRLLLSFHGAGQGYLYQTNIVSLLQMLKEFKIDEMSFIYGPSGVGWQEIHTDGELDSHFIICRKPK